MKKRKDTMTGAMLDSEAREKLAKILKHYGRSFKAQLESWIETELRIISRV